MRRTSLLTITFAALLAISPATFGGGGKHGGGSGGGQGGQGQGTQGQGSQSRQTQRSQARVHATSAQQNQYQAACANGTQARQQVRSMIKSQKKAGGDASQARSGRDQLANSVQAIDQEHRQLVNSLDSDQQIALHDRVRQSTRLVEDLDERHRSLDRALADPATDSAVLAKQARDLDRAVKAWQKEYRKLGAEMGAEAG
jgi:chromosome segregation ATPase